MGGHGAHDWTGDLLQHTGFLALAGALGTIAYQASFWWIDGDWPAFPVGELWAQFGGTFPDLHWTGAETTLLWLADKPLSAVLLVAGLGCYGLGRSLSGN